MYATVRATVVQHPTAKEAPMTSTITAITFHTPTGLGWHIEKAGRHFIVAAENPWWGNGYRSGVDVFRCDANGWVSNLKTVVTVEDTTNHWDGIDALGGAR